LAFSIVATLFLLETGFYNYMQYTYIFSNVKSLSGLAPKVHLEPKAES
jgi:hypothetical protein